MTVRTFDAVVVGAGPAGIAAARALAKNGAKVLVVDKHISPGGKSCAGGLTSTAWRAAGIDPINPPSYSTVFNAISVRAKYGETRIETGGEILVTIQRRLWTKERLAELEALGVEVHLGERFVGLDQDTIVTSRDSVFGGALVAADGARSRVRRLMGLGLGRWMRAWQLTIDAEELRLKSSVNIDVPTLWLDPDLFGPGYAWAFPARGELRIGCGAPAEAVGRTEMKRIFFSWISGLGTSVDKGEVSTGTIGCGYAGHRFGRVFLAGDAAGLASPLTGEGINQAMASGAEVAREIIDPNYRSSVIAEIAHRHRRTSDAVHGGGIGSALFKFAPLLLRVPQINKETVRRYIS